MQSRCPLNTTWRFDTSSTCTHTLQLQTQHTYNNQDGYYKNEQQGPVDHVLGGTSDKNTYTQTSNNHDYLPGRMGTTKTNKHQFTTYLVGRVTKMHTHKQAITMTTYQAGWVLQKRTRTR